MPADLDPTTAYADLRRLVATDVRQARRALAAVRCAPPEVLEAVLRLASRPGEGRVRHMIATTARVEKFADQVETWLRQWLAVESDEFARSAITAALPTAETPRPSATAAPVEMPREYLEAYRYVAQRLCHRVSSPVVGLRTSLTLFEMSCNGVADPTARSELLGWVARLGRHLQQVSRAIEFDTDDGYMAMSPIALGEWLNACGPRFSAQHGRATLAVIGTDAARRARVRASQFLLDVVFGNLWANAVQACGAYGECRLTYEVNVTAEAVDVLARDSGPGFAQEQADVAFRLQYSTNGASRGRGLLEVADAVRRLQGEVRLLPVASREYRVHIRLPREYA